MPQENRVVNKSMLPGIRAFWTGPDEQNPSRIEIIGLTQNVGYDCTPESVALSRLIKDDGFDLPERESIQIIREVGVATYIAVAQSTAKVLIKELEDQGYSKNEDPK